MNDNAPGGRVGGRVGVAAAVWRRTPRVCGGWPALFVLLAAAGGCIPACLADHHPEARRVGPIPEAVRAQHNLTPFYQKMVVAEGIPVFASGRPEDAALIEAKRLIDRVLADAPRLDAALIEAGVRVTVMATDEYTTDVPEHAGLKPRRYWDRRARGLGGTPQTPVVSCGEENLLRLPGDPYHAENILLHEFAHAVHLVGMARLDAGFDERLEAAHRAATAAGLWPETYAITNREEYFAEGAQTWFECNADVGPVHGRVRTRADLRRYDPTLAGLLQEAYGDGAWRYRGDAAAPRGGGDAPGKKRFAWPQAPGDAEPAAGPPAAASR